MKKLNKVKIIDLYIIRKFLVTFFYAIALLITIVIIFDISENVQDFIEKQAPISEILFKYYLNFIPYFVNLFSPLFTFIAVIFFTSKLAGNTEIIAILSSGISYKRLMVPYIVASIFLAGLSFYLSNFLIPYTNQNMLDFKDTYISKRIRNRDRDIHIKIANDTFVYMESWDNERNIGTNFTYEKMSFDEMSYKIASQTVKWDTLELKWTLNNYAKRHANGLDEHIETGSSFDTTLNVTPIDFVFVKDEMETMNYWELRRHIKSEYDKGSDNVKFYEVEKHRRIAFPFATIILSVIGLSVASRKSRQGMGIHLLVGLLISFSFILFMQITTVFATYGNLSPLIAVWIPNLLFLIISIYLVYAAPK
ncbi:MAG: LptF/LptG family permease [Bacteroidales bacterium]|nr:YjgP/YjgQ family permease [Bacteroidales bacterium]